MDGCCENRLGCPGELGLAPSCLTCCSYPGMLRPLGCHHIWKPEITQRISSLERLRREEGKKTTLKCKIMASVRKYRLLGGIYLSPNAPSGDLEGIQTISAFFGLASTAAALSTRDCPQEQQDRAGLNWE